MALYKLRFNRSKKEKHYGQNRLDCYFNVTDVKGSELPNIGD